MPKQPNKSDRKPARPEKDIRSGSIETRIEGLRDPDPKRSLKKKGAAR